jgi:hypothetical protein
VNILSSRLLSRNLNIKIYKSITSPAVLYGCENWSLTLREEHIVFEKKGLRGIFGTKMEEVVGGWRRLHNDELHNLYASSNTIRVIKSRIGVSCSTHGRVEK